MVCETKRRRKQTLQVRKEEIKKVLTILDKAIASRQVRVKVGPQGAIAFEGIDNTVRDDVSDACIYRQIMATGSALARMEITKAEQMAGRTVDRKVLAGGMHSHDGGKTWGSH